jgi:hypothetical protein
MTRTPAAVSLKWATTTSLLTRARLSASSRRRPVGAAARGQRPRTALGEEVVRRPGQTVSINR